MRSTLIATRPLCEKSEKGWTATVEGRPVLLLQVYTPGRTITQLEDPLRVCVLEPALVRMAVLDMYITRGIVVLVNDDS